MKYSYDRRKVASFQDRFKGSFECVVGINDFTLEKNGTITVSGMISLYLGDNGEGDIRFSDVTLKKGRDKKWKVADNGTPPIQVALLDMLLAQGGKTTQELDRLQKMK